MLSKLQNAVLPAYRSESKGNEKAGRKLILIWLK